MASARSIARLVLVVEDSDVLRKGLMTLLRREGHAVASAATVAEACAAIEAAAAADGAAAPTHVLLDLNLPDGVGAEVLRRVRECGLSARVALLTGSALTSFVEDTAALGADAVFTKPPDWDQVLSWVASD